MYKNVLITGGSRGLGFQIALSFVKTGDNVCILARNYDELLDAHNKLLENIVRIGQKVAFYVCELMDVYSIYDAHASFMQDFGDIDILINNAAIYGQLGKLEDIPFETWLYAINTNLVAPALLTKLSIPHMKERGYGKIINISGGGGSEGIANMSGYATSKAALVRFTECMALELEGTGIDINAVAPGLMKTNFVDEVLNNKNSVTEEYYNKIANYKDYSFEEPVSLVMWLASSSADGISGKFISAKWDDWRDCDKEKIMDSNKWTLRRVS